MIKKILILTILLLTFPMLAWSANPTAKKCSDKLPVSLTELIQERLPEYQVPKLTDIDQPSIQFDLQEGGDGCFSIAEGDFNGDHKQDFAILLKSINHNKVQLIVALKKRGSWKINLLPTFCETIEFCYVKPEKKGTYIRSEALDEPPVRKNEYFKLTSKNTSLISGTLESTGIVYVYSNGRWKYVWVSD